MERSVADLEERAEDLEREAADLRRENGWLKEMLIMKGRRARRPQGQSSNVDRGGAEDDEDEDSSDEEEQDDDEQTNIQPSSGSRKGKERA